MDQNDVEILERRTAYQGYFRVNEYRLRHRLFAGGWGAPITRELFERGHSVAVLPYDPVADAIIVIEQFRIGAYAAGIRPWLTECVAGIIGDGERPEEVARREAVEEMGRGLGRIEKIAHFIYTPGGSSELCWLFAGEVDSRGAGGIHGLAEEHEDIAVRVVPADVAIGWLDSGTIDNAVMLIAVSWLARHRARLRREWSETPR